MWLQRMRIGMQGSLIVIINYCHAFIQSNDDGKRIKTHLARVTENSGKKGMGERIGTWLTKKRTPPPGPLPPL